MGRVYGKTEMLTWFWWEDVEKGRNWKLRHGWEDVQVAGKVWT
jgi:hypothetical protein